MRWIVAATSLCILLGACGGGSTWSGASGGAEVNAEGVASSDEESSTGKSDKPKKDEASESTSKPKKVDPRKDGFEITLGEWAVTPEAPALKPGRVTFVIDNRGTMGHGFEIELEGDSSGHGSGDLFKAEGELLKPGETSRITVTLMEGVHKIECLVDGHDDMGMEGPLRVTKNAPKVPEKGAEESSDDQVSIADFAFSPSSLTVPVGTEVTWRNDDPTAHTVTASNDTFDSDILDAGSSYSFAFEKAGTYAYICNVHPDMKGTVKVE